MSYILSFSGCIGSGYEVFPATGSCEAANPSSARTAIPQNYIQWQCFILKSCGFCKTMHLFMELMTHASAFTTTWKMGAKSPGRLLYTSHLSQKVKSHKAHWLSQQNCRKILKQHSFPKFYSYIYIYIKLHPHILGRHWYWIMINTCCLMIRNKANACCLDAI